MFYHFPRGEKEDGRQSQKDHAAAIVSISSRRETLPKFLLLRSRMGQRRGSGGSHFVMGHFVGSNTARGGSKKNRTITSTDEKKKEQRTLRKSGKKDKPQH